MRIKHEIRICGLAEGQTLVQSGGLDFTTDGAWPLDVGVGDLLSSEKLQVDGKPQPFIIWKRMLNLECRGEDDATWILFIKPWDGT